MGCPQKAAALNGEPKYHDKIQSCARYQAKRNSNIPRPPASLPKSQGLKAVRSCKACWFAHRTVNAVRNRTGKADVRAYLVVGCYILCFAERISDSRKRDIYFRCHSPACKFA